ncbi:MAG: FeoB-associated Cys-rich membrane protein [Ruminococcus sp.]|nr:FeoB-associated Cys-rich membrane protein [Ruminococcus sp.]
MLDFLKENIGTIIVGLIVFAIVALVVIKMVRDRKQGKSSCGCGCEHCQNSQSCHGSKK